MLPPGRGRLFANPASITSPSDQNDRSCAGRRVDCLRDGVGDGNNQVRIPVDDLASEIGIARGPPLAGIALDGEVLSLDIAQMAQLLPERLPKATIWIVDAGHGACFNDRDPVLLRPFLRPRRWHRSREQQTNREIAPPHSITSSARARTDCGTVRPSAAAVLRLMTNSNFVGCMTGRSAGLAPFRILPA